MPSDTFSFYRMSIYTVMWNMISTFFILNYMIEDMLLLICSPISMDARAYGIGPPQVVVYSFPQT